MVSLQEKNSEMNNNYVLLATCEIHRLNFCLVDPPTLERDKRIQTQILRAIDSNEGRFAADKEDKASWRWVEARGAPWGWLKDSKPDHVTKSVLPMLSDGSVTAVTPAER